MTSAASVPNVASLVGQRWCETDHLAHDSNPALPGETVAVVHLASEQIAREAAKEARQALPAWSRMPAPRRAEFLERAATIIMARSASISAELTREEGKTLAEASAEVARAAAILRYFAGRAFEPVGEVYASASATTRIHTLRQPLGVVSIITPWNFPIAIPAWKIAPALVYGNTVVFKPASATPLTAHRLVEAFVDAGLPPGVVNILHGSGSTVEPFMASSPHVDALSFTGSATIGRRLQARALGSNVKVQLELGGKNAVVVCPDADIDHAADSIVRGAFASAGQKCTATSRVIAVGNIGTSLRAALSDRAMALVAGDPMDPATTLSPVIDESAKHRVLACIAAAEAGGARVVARGEVPSEGWFVGPTVLDSVDPMSPLAMEEVFGPVVAILEAGELDEALRLHNSVHYGLSGSIFTHDIQTAETFANGARVGIVHVNGDTPGAEPHVPFGGMGDSSSWSREQGHSAEQFFTQTKTIYTESLQPTGLFDY